MKARTQFLNYVNQQDLRWTSAREGILQEVFAMKGHFEAQNLAYRLRKKGKKVSTATVYRTLPLLVEAGLIKEVIHGEKHHHYECIHEDNLHDHLICLRCGKIVEFAEKSLNQVEEQICRRHHFRPEKIVVEIFGYCKECR